MVSDVQWPQRETSFKLNPITHLVDRVKCFTSNVNPSCMYALYVAQIVFKSIASRLRPNFMFIGHEEIRARFGHFVFI